ncbi:hypothetical protein SDC9_109906 [bioreactor metagenome]|uniref:Uncharacterized protein n=1 Tax=bioreactor metagenome TaxID=1076179 RepID=A0A645BD98_9ZZZZ
MVCLIAIKSKIDGGKGIFTGDMNRDIDWLIRGKQYQSS